MSVKKSAKFKSVNFFFQVEPGLSLEELLRTASRKAVSKNLATHDGSYTLFKSTSAFKKQSTISSSKVPKPKVETLDSFLKLKSSSLAPSTTGPSAPILEERYEDSTVRAHFNSAYKSKCKQTADFHF